MNVLYTSFVCGSRRTTTQETFTSDRPDLVAAVDDRLGLDVSIVSCPFTTVNEHGVFINDGDECIESYTIIS